MNMSFEEFKRRCEDVLTLEHIWLVGESRGGSCWGDKPKYKKHNNYDEPPKNDLSIIMLEDFTYSSRLYLLDNINEEHLYTYKTIYDGGYYGNYEESLVRTFNVDILYAILYDGEE